VLPVEGGEAETLTDVPLGAFDPQWMPDGSGLVFGVWLFDGHLDLVATAEEEDRRKEDPVTVHGTEERFYRYWDTWLVDGKLPHLFLLDLVSRDLKDLMPSSRLHFSWMDPAGGFAIAPSGREIVLTGLANRGKGGRPRSDLYRITLMGGGPELLTEAEENGAFRPRYAPGGRTIVFGRTLDPDFYADRARLWKMDLDTLERTPVLTGWDRSPSAWRFTEGGDLVFSAEDEGEVKLYRLEKGAQDDQHEPEALTKGGTTTGPRPAKDGRIYALHNSITQPPEVARCDPATGELERITTFAESELRDVGLGAVESVELEGAQGETIQMYVVRPPGADENTALPLLHLIHGGPHGTFGDTWHWRWHAHTFAAAGYLAACVNFQGSTSWGQDFAQRIQGALGDRPYDDVMLATDWLVDEGWADEKRMAITGGSYGGYLSAWIASKTNRFQCAINHAGVYDLALQYASDVTFGRARSMGGDLWKDPETLDRYNPARHTEGLETPMLVIHGEKDYRVPINQGLVCYGILKAKGIPARLLYFADENHWILKRENSLRWYREFLAWLARFLV